ncbi:MAG: type II toxin-antitoxin system VapC family toxin [Rhodocyclaceae bacterium]|nr:type II toxin-antitoxin system VapC family toxin [Rhodocyclaceae bacterium]
MLDTNTASHLLREHPAVVRRIVAAPMASLCISAITEGELLFGLAKRPDTKRLHLAVREFLRRVDVLPWESATAECYGMVRADMARRGKVVLAPLDLLIAAHALSVGAVLVTNDRAFGQMADLHLEDWTE